MLKRIIRVIMGWLNIGVRDFETANVKALIADLEAERDEAVRDIHKTLVETKANINDIERDMNDAKSTADKFAKAAEEALRVGNETLAGDLAMRSEEAKARFETLETAFKSVTEHYAKIDERQRHIKDEYDDAIREVKAKHDKVKLQEKMAEINDKINVTGRNGFGSRLAKVNEILNRKDSVSSAEIEVSESLNKVEIDLDKIEHTVKREDALARLKERVGGTVKTAKKSK